MRTVTLSDQEYYDIRKRKDSAYEGKFYIGVWSRGLFCRVTCPDQLPEDPEDMVYFSNIYEGFENNLVPCKDCEPDMHVEQIVLNIPVSNIVRNAVDRINDGYLNAHSVVELADSLYISERHLRKLFEQEIGISPSKIATYHRGVLAKKMLYETNFSITDIAYMSGFGSVRQFNHIFKRMYHTSPTEIRRETKHAGKENNVFYIDYKEDFNFRECLDILRKRAVFGVEVVTSESYASTFNINNMSGHFVLTDDRENSQLRLEIHASDFRCYLAVYHKIQRMFDLNTNFSYVREVLEDTELKDYLRTHNIPRLLLWFNPTICLYYALIRQELPERDVLMTLGDLAEQQGRRYQCNIDGLFYIFPSYIELGEWICRRHHLSLEMSMLIRHMNKALDVSDITLAYNQSYREFQEQFNLFPEIWETTVNYVAMYALGMQEGYCCNDVLNKFTAFRAYASLILKHNDLVSSGLTVH